MHTMAEEQRVSISYISCFSGSCIKFLDLRNAIYVEQGLENLVASVL
jgi:hypothetical protein